MSYLGAQLSAPAFLSPLPLRLTLDQPLLSKATKKLDGMESRCHKEEDPKGQQGRLSESPGTPYPLCGQGLASCAQLCSSPLRHSKRQSLYQQLGDPPKGAASGSLIYALQHLGLAQHMVADLMCGCRAPEEGEDRCAAIPLATSSSLQSLGDCWSAGRPKTSQRWLGFAFVLNP